MHSIDWTIIAAYFFLLFGVAWWLIRRNKSTSEDYFLAGRNLTWWLIGASIFASNIGSEHLVGLAGSGMTDGVKMAHYELHAWCLLVLAWILIPFYMRSRVFTMPEFLEKRFSTGSRYLLTSVSLIAYVLTKVAVGVFAGGIVFKTLLPEANFLGMDAFWTGSIAVILLTGAYTIFGGLRAVVYTETIQTGILVIGSALVTYFGIDALGGGNGFLAGWEQLRATCGSEMFNLWAPIVPEGYTAVWEPVKDAASKTQAWYFSFDGHYPWVGMLLCAPVIGLWYWCTDQYIVQRVLGAPNEKVARQGAIFAGLLKLLPVFIFIIPGMVCFALVVSNTSVEGVTEISSVVLDAKTGEVNSDEAQAAFPLMVKHILPVGVRGIVVAGLLSALMSSLAGAFNACSTLFTMDLYQKMRPDTSQAKLVWVGRIATLVMVLLGLAWLPVIQGNKGLYEYLQSVQGYLSAPIFVVFFAGIFHKRLNAQGAFWALIVGFVLGLFRLGVDTPGKLIEGFAYTEGNLFWIVQNTYFQYYSLFITFVSLAVMFVVSYLTKEPDAGQIKGLAYGTISPEEKAVSRKSWGAGEVVPSVVLVLAIVAAYLYFRG